MPAVGSTPSFGRRVVLHLKKEVFGNTWWCGLNIMKGRIWWRVQDGHWHRGINLGSKCCNHGRLGVVLEKGYKYKPLMFVKGIEQFNNKPAPCHLFESFSRVVEFFERSHRSVNLRKYRQPCIMSSIMWWI
jgi:hypothetical protein